MNEFELSVILKRHMDTINKLTDDIKALAIATATAIQYACPITNEDQQKLIVCQKICKQIIER